MRLQLILMQTVPYLHCVETEATLVSHNKRTCRPYFNYYTVGYITEYDPDYSTSNSGVYITDIECPSQPYNNLRGCNITEGTCTKNPLSISCVRGLFNFIFYT